MKYSSTLKSKSDNGESADKQQTIYTDQQLEETIDFLLQSMDLNKDGFIEYTEYKNNVWITLPSFLCNINE